MASLIANENSPFKDADKDYLSSLSDDRLKEFEAAAEASAERKPEVDQKANSADLPANVEVPKTVDEALMALPEQFRDVLAGSLRTHEAKVDGLIKQIVDSGYKVHSEDELRAMGVERLQELAEFVAPKTFALRGMPRTEAAEKTNEAKTPNFPVFGEGDPLAKAVN